MDAVIMKKRMILWTVTLLSEMIFQIIKMEISWAKIVMHLTPNSPLDKKVPSQINTAIMGG